MDNKDEPMDSSLPSSPKKEQPCVLQIDSEDVKNEVAELVYASYLDNATGNPWHPKAFEKVKNEEVQKRYETKKSELKKAGRMNDELKDSFAFLIAKSKKDYWAIVQSGLHSAMSLHSVFGPPKSGVYLYQHADLCLKNFALAHPVEKDVQLIVFKYMEGKKKSFIANTGPTDTKELLPGIDCHVSSLKPVSTDKPELQFLKSQIYLYELDEYDFPACRPRHCCPFAIVTFTKATLVSPISTPSSGVKSLKNGGEIQLRGAERFAKYPGLVDIIAGINSKPSVKKTGPQGKSDDVKPLLDKETPRKDSTSGTSDPTINNPKLQSVIDKVNSKKSEKSLFPMHKNRQQPSQGYQPYRQIHPGQRGGNMNPRLPGSPGMNAPRGMMPPRPGFPGNALQNGRGMSMMGSRGPAPNMMHPRPIRPPGIYPNQQGHMGITPSQELQMMNQNYQQGMQHGNMNNFNNPSLQQPGNKFSLLDPFPRNTGMHQSPNMMNRMQAPGWGQ